MNEAGIAELLDGLTPNYEDSRGNWERVVASAKRGRRARLGASAVVALAAAAALALAWPFHSGQGSLVDRALAAAGQGPVLHVVLRGDFGGTLVNLRTGERTPVYGDDEYWYDTAGGRLHTMERIGSAIQTEEVSKPEQPPTELQALGRDYRRALEDSTARVAGSGTVDGQPVTWLMITRQLLPDVADGKDHEFTQQVAVSRLTFKPLALRATRDGVALSGTFQRVLGLEYLQAGAGDFTASPDRSMNGGAIGSEGRTPIPLAQARRELGRAPLWLGSKYEGLPLSAAYRDTNRIGRRKQIRITGERAAAIKRCASLHGQAGGRCIRSLGLKSSVEVNPEGVFHPDGPITWTEKETDLVLFYGTVGDDPRTYPKDSVPLYDRPHVTLSETLHPTPLRRLAGSYEPPKDSVFLAAGGTGFLQVDGIDIGIEAAGEKAILAAARALVLMP